METIPVNEMAEGLERAYLQNYYVDLVLNSGEAILCKIEDRRAREPDEKHVSLTLAGETREIDKSRITSITLHTGR